ncbi:MAG TPA: hypothetical protein VK892_16670 [Pyrinomonadaceae bacterium]|nr:hypothetical protein [Pyrinomonadaceae bacterium]
MLDQYDAVVTTETEFVNALQSNTDKSILVDGFVNISGVRTVPAGNIIFRSPKGRFVWQTGGELRFNGLGITNPTDTRPLFYDFPIGKLTFQGNDANYPHKISSEIVAFTNSTENKSLSKRLDVLQAAFSYTALVQMPKEVTIVCESKVTLNSSGVITDHLRRLDKSVHWRDRVTFQFGAGEFLVNANEFYRNNFYGEYGNPSGNDSPPLYWNTTNKGNLSAIGEKGTVFRIKAEPYNTTLFGAAAGESNIAARYENIHFKDFTIIDEGFVTDDAAATMFFGNCHHGSAENITFIGCMAFNLTIGTYGGATYGNNFAYDIKVIDCTFIDFSNQPLDIVGGAKNIQFIRPVFLIDKGAKTFSFSCIMDFEPNHYGEEINGVTIEKPKFHLQNYLRRLTITPDMVKLSTDPTNPNTIVFPTPHGLQKGHVLIFSTTGTGIGTAVMGTNPQTTGMLTGTLSQANEGYFAVPVDEYRLKLAAYWRDGNPATPDLQYPPQYKQNLVNNATLVFTSAGTGVHTLTSVFIQAIKIQNGHGQKLRNISIYDPEVFGLEENPRPGNTDFPSIMHTPIELGGIYGGGIFGGNVRGSLSGAVHMTACRNFRVEGLQCSDIYGTAIANIAGVNNKFTNNFLEPGVTAGTAGKTVNINEAELTNSGFSDATGGGTIYITGQYKPTDVWIGKQVLFEDDLYTLTDVLAPATVDGAYVFPCRVTPNPGTQGSGASMLPVETRFSSSYYGINPGAIVNLHADSQSVVSAGIPSGGQTNEVLAKNSPKDYDVYFAPLSGGGIQTVVARVNMGSSGVAGWTGDSGVSPEIVQSPWVFDGDVDNTLTPDVPEDIFETCVYREADAAITRTISGLDTSKTYTLELFFAEPQRFSSDRILTITVNSGTPETFDPKVEAGNAANKSVAHITNSLTGISSITFSIQYGGVGHTYLCGYRVTEEA